MYGAVRRAADGTRSFSSCARQKGRGSRLTARKVNSTTTQAESSGATEPRARVDRHLCLPFPEATSSGLRQLPVDRARVQLIRRRWPSSYRAHDWHKLLEAGKFKSLSDLPREMGLDVPSAARLLRLTLLAPDIALSNRYSRVRFRTAPPLLVRATLSREANRSRRCAGRRNGWLPILVKV